MSEWQSTIPWRDRSDPLYEAAIAAGELSDPNEQRVAQNIAVELETEHRLHSVGDALDALAAASFDQKRGLLDRARESAGLPSATAIEDARRAEAVQADARAGWNGRDRQGRAFMGCAHPGCMTLPIDPDTGKPMAIKARRWWCPVHRGEAGPQDHLPPEEGRVDPATMALRPPPGEVARMEAEREKLREEDRERNRRRRAEARAIREARERYLAANPPQPPGGGCAPGSKFR